MSWSIWSLVLVIQNPLCHRRRFPSWHHPHLHSAEPKLPLTPVLWTELIGFSPHNYMHYNSVPHLPLCLSTILHKNSLLSWKRFFKIDFLFIKCLPCFGFYCTYSIFSEWLVCNPPGTFGTSVTAGAIWQQSTEKEKEEEKCKEDNILRNEPIIDMKQIHIFLVVDKVGFLDSQGSRKLIEPV